MRDVRAVVYGVGAMGSILTRLLLDKGVKIVGAVGRSPEKVGRDLGDVAGLGRKIGVAVDSDPHRALADGADIAVVWAETKDGIGGFIVEKDMAGFSAEEIKHKFSLRASVTSSLFFDNVRVPEANRLPGAKGLKGPLSCLTQARYGITWGVIGAAQACLQEVLDYTGTRVLFGKPLNQTQTIQIRLADMARRITGAQVISLHLGRLKDAGKMMPAQVSLSKWNNVRMALDIARDARDMLGGAGISAEMSAIRHMLNLESVITYEGTETVHQLTIGKELTGVSAF